MDLLEKKAFYDKKTKEFKICDETDTYFTIYGVKSDNPNYSSTSSTKSIKNIQFSSEPIVVSCNNMNQTKENIFHFQGNAPEEVVAITNRHDVNNVHFEIQNLSNEKLQIFIPKQKGRQQGRKNSNIELVILDKNCKSIEFFGEDEATIFQHLKFFVPENVTFSGNICCKKVIIGREIVEKTNSETVTTLLNAINPEYLEILEINNFICKENHNEYETLDFSRFKNLKKLKIDFFTDYRENPKVKLCEIKLPEQKLDRLDIKIGNSTKITFSNFIRANSFFLNNHTNQSIETIVPAKSEIDCFTYENHWHKEDQTGLSINLLPYTIKNLGFGFKKYSNVEIVLPNNLNRCYIYAQNIIEPTINLTAQDQLDSYALTINDTINTQNAKNNIGKFFDNTLSANEKKIIFSSIEHADESENDQFSAYLNGLEEAQRQSVIIKKQTTKIKNNTNNNQVFFINNQIIINTLVGLGVFSSICYCLVKNWSPIKLWCYEFWYRNLKKKQISVR